MSGRVIAIFVCPVAGQQMQSIGSVEAIAGQGLSGDRYCTGDGSFNKGAQGKRQVTFINGMFFAGSGFEFSESRRNIVTDGVELMRLIDTRFKIGDAEFEGVKYCYPCNRPSTLSGNQRSFNGEFSDRGGLIASVLVSGSFKIGDTVII